MIIKKWSRILLPELQLLDFKKRERVQKQPNQQMIQQTPQAIQLGNQQVAPGLSTSGGAALPKEISVQQTSKERKKSAVIPDQLDQTFVLAEQMVKSQVYGQSEYVDGLLLWFKKQQLLGGSFDGKANAIAVFGPHGTGKKKGVEQTVQALHHYKVLPTPQVMTLDMSIYSDKDVHSNFIRDCSSAFALGKATVVLKGLDGATQAVLDYVTLLVKQGWFRTESGIVIDAADHLLVFVAEKERDLPKIISDQLVEKLKTIPLTQDVMYQITTEMIERALTHVKERTGLQVTYTSDMPMHLAKLSIEHKGFGSLIHRWTMGQVVERLISERAKAQLRESESLIWKDGAIYLRINDTLLFKPEQMERTSVEQSFAKLEQLIGLQEVKTFVHELASTIELQAKRKEAGMQNTALTLHMIFAGNPGTGKTTVARLVAGILQGLGVLSRGQLVEVARQDLVGEYVGHTGPKTMAKVQEALGGVLFIDEAYALSRNKQDTFGTEAIDTLVKGMEDYREDLVVILAGYTKEMEGFLKTNPGLPSRFPLQVEFSDYQPEELLTMLQLMAVGRDYQVAPEAAPALLNLFERKQIPGRNDSGNGRLVRNILEEAIRKQAARISEEGGDFHVLHTFDFGAEEEESFQLEEALSKFIGLSSVKEFVRTLEKQLFANKRRKEAGLEVRTEQVLNMVFTGNPGTGKTTIAQTIALMLKELGILKRGHLVEVGRSELVSGYVGQTAEKTKEVVESALGGVLFIDEAYALAEEGSGFGDEAIHELVRLIELHKNEVIVIMAGYNDEMKTLLSKNPGLESRFPLHVHFPDYEPSELVRILHMFTEQRGFLLSNEHDLTLERLFDQKQKEKREASGNGRMVRNVLESAIRRQSVRVADSEAIIGNALIELRLEDFEVQSKAEDEATAKEELTNIIGLQSVKTLMENLFAQVAMNERRKELGLPEISGQSLHMSFTGNPGTGKTTIARIVAKRLNELGVIPSYNLVETDRSGLVAGYSGQTALKTKEVIESARGGVLFIDEAYSLAGDSFGQEAIDAIVKAMEDLKGELVVIVAGYEKEMEGFWSSNSGLRSRFPQHMPFPDYTAHEMLQIARGMLQKKGYSISKQAEITLETQCVKEENSASSGNGRFVRNVVEASIRKHAVRLVDQSEASMEILTTILEEDVAQREELS
ncbi:AAA family ATPase [Alkalicoccobacillus porphyridii]|uniref:AAA family ATPase n=1 Tax=Alkalicoccobacillus porphyridii TaxID=2597270 RepID=A0A554A1K0_9BACI|nr:AAA family ATPase [Alkalicoccobacillus porphyridii]